MNAVLTYFHRFWESYDRVIVDSVFSKLGLDWPSWWRWKADFGGSWNGVSLEKCLGKIVLSWVNESVNLFPKF